MENACYDIAILPKFYVLKLTLLTNSVDVLYRVHSMECQYFVTSRLRLQKQISAHPCITLISSLCRKLMLCESFYYYC